MNDLIVYHSKYGQTRKIAMRMSEMLGSAGDQVTLQPNDKLIVGAPIYATRH